MSDLLDHGSKWLSDLRRRHRTVPVVYAMRLGGELGSQTVPAHQVVVRNDTGSDLDRFAVLAVREPVIAAADNEAEYLRTQAYAGVAPELVDEVVVVTREPIVADAFGVAVISGLSPAKVDVIAEWHRYARPVSGATAHLQSSPWGPARLLHHDPGPGVQWATVLLDNRPVGPCIYPLSISGHGASTGMVWNVTQAALAELAGMSTSDTLALVLETPDADTMTVLAEGTWCAPDLVATTAEYLSTGPGIMTTDPNGDGTWRVLLHRGNPDGLVFWYPRLQRNIGICVAGSEVPHWVDCETI